MKKKYTKKQITEAIAYWKKQLKESIDVPSIWLEKTPTTALECIDVLESIIGDLIYELNERGGYDLLDDAESVAEDTINKLKNKIGNNH